jgi:hypothetical protein
MKRLIVSALCVAIFCVGLGAIAENVGARFKSDEKALDIIAKARVAIGGDAAISGIRSIVIKGQTTNTITADGTERSIQGETEIALQLPNQYSKMIKRGNVSGISSGDGHAIGSKDIVVLRNGESTPFELRAKDGVFTTPDGKTVTVTKADGALKEVVTVMGDHIIRKDEASGEAATADGRKITIVRTGEDKAEFKVEAPEGESPDGKVIHLRRTAEAGVHGVRQNELLRTTLALLLTAPEGLDVTYTFVGESQVDGTAVNIVAASAQGSTFKLYFDRSSNMPVGMSYVGHAMPFVIKMKRDGDKPEDPAETKVFARTLEGAGAAVEQFVRFSDFRNTNGVMMPYNWTTTVAGAVREVFEIASVEVNPANIAERFSGNKVMYKTAKPEDQK